MKSILIVLVAIMCLCVATSAQTPPQAEPNDPQQMKQQARRLAEELLAGKEIVVRLYRDCLSDPCSFELLNVPLDGTSISADAIRLAFAKKMALQNPELTSLIEMFEYEKAIFTVFDQMLKPFAKIRSQINRIDNFTRRIRQYTLEYEPGSLGTVSRILEHIRDVVNATKVDCNQILESADSLKTSLNRFADAAQICGPLSKSADLPTFDINHINKYVSTTETMCEQIIQSDQQLLSPAFNQLHEAIDKLKETIKQPEPVPDALDNQLAQLDTLVSSINRVFGNMQKKLEAAESNPVPIKSYFDQMVDQNVIVITDKEQKDQAVAALLEDFVYAFIFRPARWQKNMDLMYPILEDTGYKWWTFLDAVGNPIPKAEIEMRIGIGYGFKPGDNAEIWLGRAVLDEKGKLKRIKRGCSESRFIFNISAANYGTAIVETMHCPSLAEPTLTYVVPLVSLDSPAASLSVSGTITDQQGNPIQNAEVSCEHLNTPGNIQRYIGNFGLSFTNEKGWFNLYTPTCKERKFKELSRKLIPIGSTYNIKIQPPKELNLRQYTRQIAAGAKLNVTLTAMDANEFFHIFAFEDNNKPITDIDLLKRTIITLNRDGRDWFSLEYDDWKDGSYLPLGTLRARTTRWGDPFSFKPIELTADSPEKLVFKTWPEIQYRGSVVDETTGEPMPGVLVLADHMLGGQDPCSIKDEYWDHLYTQALKQSEAPSEKILFSRSDRVAITDANGCFEIRFKPGLNNALYHFTALEKGLKARPVDSSYITHYRNVEGVVELPPIVMSLPKSKSETYLPALPTLIFEDEYGPVTDPNMLKQVRLKITNDSTRRIMPYTNWLKSKKLIAGTYHATADWNEKYYVFEPVEITAESPDPVIFKIQRIEDGQITYRGQVVDGVTGAPIAGAFVMDSRPSHEIDLSDLAAEQWDAISSLDPETDPNNSALGVLKGTFGGTTIARTNSAGWYQIPLKRKKVGLFGAGFLAVYKDYLAAQQQLKYPVVNPNNNGNPYRRFIYKEFPQDEDGYVTLPPMKLFPAGTIICEPYIPNPDSSQKADLRLNWFTREDDKTPWLKDLWASPRDNQGGSIERKCDLRLNQIQTAYVAANVELTIQLNLMRDSKWAPVTISGIRLRKGKVLDLGRVDFKLAVKVAVKVVDPKGAPVAGVSVILLDNNSHYSNLSSKTDEYGITMINVPPYSIGQLVVEHWIDIMSDKKLREGIPYEVAGQEDAGKIFTLQLSNEMLDALFD